MKATRPIRKKTFRKIQTETCVETLIHGFWFGLQQIKRGCVDWRVDDIN